MKFILCMCLKSFHLLVVDSIYGMIEVQRLTDPVITDKRHSQDLPQAHHFKNIQSVLIFFLQSSNFGSIQEDRQHKNTVAFVERWMSLAAQKG